MSLQDIISPSLKYLYISVRRRVSNFAESNCYMYFGIEADSHGFAESSVC